MNRPGLTVCTLACALGVLGVLLSGCSQGGKSRGHELRKAGQDPIVVGQDPAAPAATSTAPAGSATLFGPPVSEFFVDPTTSQGFAPLTVVLDDRSTQSPTTWAWNFGDGSTATTQSPTHTYTTPGSYTVTLQTTNGYGAGTTVTKRDVVIVANTDQGSRFWYENDTYGQPFKTHDAARAAMAQEVLTLVNAERAAASVGPLTYDSEAERAALAHSEDMAARGFFDHVTPEGWQPEDRLRMMRIFGYLGNGENVAVGQPTAQIAMRDWMSSPGHRANILEPSYTHLGVGIAGSQPHWTQVFLIR